VIAARFCSRRKLAQNSDHDLVNFGKEIKLSARAIATAGHGV
jgi:hypothetical protein